MAPPDDTALPPYRAPDSRCIELQQQVAGLNALLAAKRRSPQYQFKWRDADVPYILRLLNIVCMVIAPLYFHYFGSNNGAALFFWPFLPLVYFVHGITVVKKN